MNIGVIDSGVGGLTVLFDVIKKYPKFNYFYIGDSKNCPYGEKSNEQINELSFKMVEYLVKNNNIDILLIACNSISATSYENLKEKFPNLIIIETVIPTANYVKNLDNIKRVGVISTTATFNSYAYENALDTISTMSCACPEFVEFVESGNVGEYEEEIIHNHLLPLLERNIDALILGCTHFPLLIPAIEKFYNGKIITSSIAMINELDKYVKEETGDSILKIYTTGSKDKFKKQIKTMFNKEIDVEQIEL